MICVTQIRISSLLNLVHLQVFFSYCQDENLTSVDRYIVHKTDIGPSHKHTTCGRQFCMHILLCCVHRVLCFQINSRLHCAMHLIEISTHYRLPQLILVIRWLWTLALQLWGSLNLLDVTIIPRLYFPRFAFENKKTVCRSSEPFHFLFDPAFASVVLWNNQTQMQNLLWMLWVVLNISD